MDNARVLVLGATGFVGRSVCARLEARGTGLRVLTRDLLKARPLQVIPSIEIVTGSPHDDADLARALDGVDAAVNLVGILHQSRREPFEKVHVELPRRLARACRAAGVRRLVHMSALHAGRDGPSEYLRSRGRGEDAIREEGAGLAVTIFRPSVIFGQDDSFLNLFAGLVRFLPVVPLAGAGTKFQPVWVEDVARTVAACLDDPRTSGKTYELCGPGTYALAQIVDFVAGLQGRKRLVVPLPGWAAQAQAYVLEHLPGPVMTRDNLASMKVDSVCGCPFPEELGFAPATMEAIVPEYMAAAGLRGRYADYRRRGGR
ncbi:MAG TPA: complex I NDUFA9 subunit family protein [Usitatibacteraceae bacterium]|nr:complex I NDUFA9 subunit family protein [Usitatibacteraceae bacterium]